MQLHIHDTLLGVFCVLYTRMTLLTTISPGASTASGFLWRAQTAKLATEFLELDGERANDLPVIRPWQQAEECNSTFKTGAGCAAI